MNEYSIVYRLHAIQRMLERNVNNDELRQIINEGKVIEKYSDTIKFLYTPEAKDICNVRNLVTISGIIK